MEVHTIAVIGAGAMGREIAYAAAFGGYWTILEDISREVLDQSLAWVKSAFDEGVLRREVQAHARDGALAKLGTARTVDGAIRDADLIIEAVAEEMEMKIELFTLFDKFSKPGAIFASTTSSLSIAEMAAVTFCPERCLGMRFLPRVPKMQLCQAPETSEETIAACSQVASRMGKEVLVVQESRVTNCAKARVGQQAPVCSTVEAGQSGRGVHPYPWPRTGD
jgi:3-hydroxybutyryl-CoA dehydrogenase